MQGRFLYSRALEESRWSCIIDELLAMY